MANQPSVCKLETPAALEFLEKLYDAVTRDLERVLEQRLIDRKFIDERTQACADLNLKLGYGLSDSAYKTVLGLEDGKGRVVFGPKRKDFALAGGKPVAQLPEFLKGTHVTYFSAPDDEATARAAMNARHCRLPNEPSIVEELLSGQKSEIFWGADFEDSKTPIAGDLACAMNQMSACFDKTLPGLAKSGLSHPVKRLPSISTKFRLANGKAVPLHLYDFALHFFRHHGDPRALVFYIPKLESEEEAQYFKKVFENAERLIAQVSSAYEKNSLRAIVVFENARAIFRVHEIADALEGYFAGASLGWHDFLASAARLFKNDSQYRIPVKADPNIVIRYIQASHRLVARVVGSRGGVVVGGMYGVLPIGEDLKSHSFQVSLRGYFKDVVTQLRRGLNGFWAARPDFARLGLAIVEAWRRREAGDSTSFDRLVSELLEPTYRQEVLTFVSQPDVSELSSDDSTYCRALIVANISQSNVIANNDPEEIRYNVFQSIQYLAAWLVGRACASLPATIEGVSVRVLDDLATVERSRWEVWHEVHYGRFSVEKLIRVFHEEMNFIRRDLSNDKKIVQVKFDSETAKWYPAAFRVLMKLMTDRVPVEFATELLFPLVASGAKDDAAMAYSLEPAIARYDHYFEICGSERFASAMARNAIEDRAEAQAIVESFSIEDILSAASFHGDIGQAAKTLDARASKEQSGVRGVEDSVLAELRTLGATYLKKYGFKFLISAAGKSAEEMLVALKERLNHTREVELDNARAALWQITLKRMMASPLDSLKDKLETLRLKHRVTGAAIALNSQAIDDGHFATQTLSFGEAHANKVPVKADTLFEIASLSKTLASAFSIEFFRSHGISLDTSVNTLFENAGSSFRLRSKGDAQWADQVTITHLMNHSALDMHYVKGVAGDAERPSAKNYVDQVSVINEPGRVFQYSGGGFIVLEHLIETLSKKSVREATREFLDRLGLKQLTFDQKPALNCARGYFDSGEEVKGSRYHFPAFAAGALSSGADVAKFLAALALAHSKLEGFGLISHDTAIAMLEGSDRGCRDFMGCLMGVGVFTVEAGRNRFMLHQGANEGFRAIFLQCYSGPDSGKGVVVLCNGDNRAVLFIADVVREILSHWGVEGIDFSSEKFINESGFSAVGISQEQIVNRGYKSLILSAFEADLPEAIIDRGPVDPLSSANLVVESKVVSVSNQKFARVENLISRYEPAFDPELFGRQGKIMDSWESARHNPEPADVLVLELKRASRVRYVSFSTEFHDGNHPAKVRLSTRQSRDREWIELLATPLNGHSFLGIDLGEKEARDCVLQVKVEIFPDGGLSRLGLYDDLPSAATARFHSLENAKSIRFVRPIPKSHKPLAIPYSATPKEVNENIARAEKAGLAIDWASLAFGAKLVSATNEHYGPAVQVISPYSAIHMFDGLESARSRKPGHHEEVTIALGKEVAIRRIVFDFTFFVNNNPLDVSVEGFSNGKWHELVARARVKAFAGNQKEFAVRLREPCSQIRVKTFPDGGVNRIHVYA